MRKIEFDDRRVGRRPLADSGYDDALPIVSCNSFCGRDRCFCSGPWTRVVIQRNSVRCEMSLPSRNRRKRHREPGWQWVLLVGGDGSARKRVVWKPYVHMVDVQTGYQNKSVMRHTLRAISSACRRPQVDNKKTLPTFASYTATLVSGIFRLLTLQLMRA